MRVNASRSIGQPRVVVTQERLVVRRCSSLLTMVTAVALVGDLAQRLLPEWYIAVAVAIGDG